MKRPQADEQDLLIWDNEIRRLSGSRGDEGRVPAKPAAPTVQPAKPMHTMTNPSGNTQRS